MLKKRKIDSNGLLMCKIQAQAFERSIDKMDCSSDVFISKSGNNVGLYCGDCGKWITWLNKDQLRLVERQIANKRGDALKILLEKNN